MMLVAVLMVAPLLVPSLPAQAQQFASPPCPDGTVTATRLLPEGDLLCIIIPDTQVPAGSPAPELDCPGGFARSKLLEINPRFDDYACALLAEEAPLPGGGGNDNGGGGGNDNARGGGAAPLEITQDFEQESEAGEVDQSFEVS